MSATNRKVTVPLILFLSFTFFFLVYISPMAGLAFASFMLIFVVSLINREKVFFAFIFLYPMIPRYFAIDLGSSLPLLTGARLLIFYTITFDFIFNRFLFNDWRYKLKNFKFKTPLIIYLLVIVLNFMIYPYNESFKNLIAVGIEYFFVLFYVFFRLQNKDEINKALNIFLYSSLIVGLFGLIEFLSNINIFSYLDIVKSERILTSSETTVRLNESRVEGPFGHPLAYCNYLMLSIPLSVYMLLKNIKTRYKGKYLCICIILTLNLILTLSRGPLLSILVGFVIYFLFLEPEIKRKIKILTIGIGGVVAAGFVTGFLPSVIRDFFKSVMDVILMRNSVSGFGGNVDPKIYRLFLFKVAQNLVFENNTTSIFFGRGFSFLNLNQIFFYIPAFRNTIRIRSIDNNFLLKLIDTGILGLGAELLILAQIVIMCIKRYFKKIDKQFYAFFIFLTVSYYTCLFTVAELGTMKIYWLMLGIAMYKIYIDDTNSKASPKLTNQ